MWAVVGLGNPGRHYSRTRHNVGFIFIRKLAKLWGVRVKKNSHQSKVVIVKQQQGPVLLGMPQTFMNASGQAVKKISVNCEIPPERIIVVYDDFDLPLGDIRIRKAGGAGSHKGVASIIQELGLQEFPRIRIGIGPIRAEDDPVEFVLSRFTAEEEPLLGKSLDNALTAVSMILGGEIDKAMSQFN